MYTWPQCLLTSTVFANIRQKKTPYLPIYVIYRKAIRIQWTSININAHVPTTNWAVSMKLVLVRYRVGMESSSWCDSLGVIPAFPVQFCENHVVFQPSFWVQPWLYPSTYIVIQHDSYIITFQLLSLVPRCLTLNERDQGAINLEWFSSRRTNDLLKKREMRLKAAGSPSLSPGK